MDTDVYRLEIEHANRRAAVLASTKRQEVAYRHVAMVDDTLPRRQEKLALIRLLRDQTHSRDVYDRCVAIVGRE